MLSDISLFVLYIVVLLVLAKPLGQYIYKVFTGTRTFMDGLLTLAENAIYRIGGINSSQNMNWKEYAKALLMFNGLGILAVFVLQMFQGVLPLNPEGFTAPSWHSALNTAVSFVTNTNWQSYAGETTLSYFTQMTALTVQNFVSAATGLAVAVALMRGLTAKGGGNIGNFWVDLVRGTLWVLLPLSIIFAVLLIQQGVIQNSLSYLTITTVEGVGQVLPMGPVASQEAIKLLGTNGGGFFNANSAHPFENPTVFTNFLQMLMILLIPTASIFAYGYFAKDHKQGYTILGSMLLLFVLMLTLAYSSETVGNPLLQKLGLIAPAVMEGKEVRFGQGGSVLFSIVTTAASCGAVNTMHDSLTPLAGLATMLQIMLGEVHIGGVGAGFYGMIMYVLLTVFIVGLMVGRTPEYLGKKIEALEIKAAIMGILIPAVTMLVGSAYASLDAGALASLNNQGAHGLSEILYAFASAAGNNGSAFAGLNANTVFYNLSLAVVMLLGRFGVIVPILMIAGSMSAKNILPAGSGTFSTGNILFVLLLSGVVLTVGALTFVPALVLGPITEHLLLK